MASGSKAIMLQQRPQHPTVTATPHYPLPCTIFLPPLSKGGGLTARHKLLLCCFLLAICPPFLYCKLFCRQDGGIVLHPHHQLDFPHYLPPHSPKKNTKICHLSKQRILYIQFSALVKMVSGSKATML